MFCMSCGTKLPDNARFCSSCGTPVSQASTSSPPNADDRVSRAIRGEKLDLTPEELDIAGEGLARIQYPEIAEFQQLAETGAVTTQDVERAIQALNKIKSNPLTRLTSWNALNYFALAKDTEHFFRQRYMSPESNRKAKQKILTDDWYLYVSDGIDGLLGLCPLITKDQASRLSHNLNSLGQWLEDEIAKNLLLALWLENVQVTKDSLTKVALILGDQRFGQISRYVAGMMDMVKK